ncbi:MAG: hypothetical protein ACTS22_06810 [Phycisphaerales bacterium]
MMSLANRILHAAGSLRAQRRRGTILLLVLGALAMVLILTVVYAALGKGDRQTARAVQDQQDARDVIDDVATYLLGIPGEDVTDLVPDLTEQTLLDALKGGNAGLADARFRLERVDAPLTDFIFRSSPQEDPTLDALSFAQQDLFRFRPSGGHAAGALWPDAFPGLDPRIPNDPWLAATRPFDLGPGSKDFLRDGTYLNNPYFERALDWPQISNIAPDGRFVNLFYLRSARFGAEPGGAAGEGFDAPSLNLSRDPDTGEARLGLFDADGELQMGNDAELPFGDLLDATGNELPFDEDEPDWNRPAHWTMYQRAMHRSIAELNRLDSANDPSRDSYWAYQYADADGNGIIDSRWQELVDASRGNEFSLLTQSDRRYFIAARIIDLSSLVNVNTAGDLIAVPTLQARPGEGPHEVSLFSLLNMSWHPFAVSRSDQPLHYGSGNGNPFFGAFDVPESQGTSDPSELANDYTEVAGNALNDYTTGLLGRKAYKRVRQSIIAWEALPYELTPTRRGLVEDPGTFGGVYREPDVSLYTLDLDAASRRDSYISYGSTSPGVTVGGNGRIGPFGTDDLVELLTFHGANDPDLFSNLEQAFVSEDRVDESTLLSKSLLRSDRDLAAEVGERTFLAPGTDGTAGVAERESNRMARAAADIRSLLTTVSGDRPLRSRVVNAAGVSELDEQFRRLRLDDLVIAPAISYTALPDLADNAVAQRELSSSLLRNSFAVYAATLAPYADEGGWDPNPTAFNAEDALKTQFYGHEGPELALRLAAHLAVNFRDMADAPTIDRNGDGVPETDLTSLDLSSATGAVQFSARADEPTRALLWLTSDDQRRQNARTARPALTELETQGFVLDADTLYGGTQVLDPAPVGNQPAASTDAIIVHGVEAQPFLAEVVFMNAFFDAPRGGDDEDPAGPLGGDGDVVSEYRTNTTAGVFDEFAADGMVNIDWTPDGTRRGNPDFLFQLVAFQLFNPFDVPVRLEDMYIEFGDVFYRFDSLGGSVNTVIQPRETIVAYATNPGLALGSPSAINDNVQRRLDDAAAITAANGGGAAPVPPSFDDVLNVNLGDPAAPGTPRRLPLRRFDASLVEIDELAADGDLLEGTLTPGAGRDNPVNRIAMLWRDLGDKRDASAWQLADRRDDVLLDRMTDRDGADPILDQRLALGDQPIDAGFVGGVPTAQQLIEAFTVENALKGYENNVRFGEFVGASLTGTNYNENRQLSVLLWGKLRRFDDPAVGSAATNRLLTTAAGESIYRYGAVTPPGAGPAVPGQLDLVGVPAGAYPATVLEPFAPLLGAAGANIRTSSETESDAILIANDGIHVVNSFDRTGAAIAGVSQKVPETANTLAEFFLRLVGQSADAEANLLADNFLSTRVPLMGVFRYNPGTFADFSPILLNPLTEPYEEHYLTFSRNGLEFRDLETGASQLRVGDMLLPLAVGPYRRPLETTAAVDDSTYPSDPAERLEAYEKEWVTLGEALAVVAGYSDQVGPSPLASGLADPFDRLRVIDTTTVPVTDERVLDRGRLRLDAFVPYVEFNPAPGLDEGEDRRRGSGVPLALTIFEIAQAGGELQADAYGGLDRAVMGLVNLNTAPPSVLRTLPGLFPDTWYDSNDAAGGGALSNPRSFFWDRRVQAGGSANAIPDLNVFEPAPAANPDLAFDIASSVLAYRDAATGHLRLQRQPGGVAGFGQPRPYDMGLTGADTDGAPFSAQLGPALTRARSGIDGIRRTPGFESIGELLAVRTTNPADPAQHSIDWLARDGRTLGASFVDQVVPITDIARDRPVDVPMNAGEAEPNPGQRRAIATVDPQLFGDLLLYRAEAAGQFDVPGPDQIADDYDEQLVQINMLLNSVSTSSDYYAAWFVVHGYEREDTEVSDTDPLTPSFRGRYLMIIDRSEVIGTGDRPRVLAFLELPYDVPTEYTVVD